MENKIQMHEGAITKLPKKRKMSAVEYVDRRSIWRLITEGLVLYLGIVLLMTLIQRLLISSGVQVVNENGNCVTEWLDLSYFNLVTILTIGYGDYAPIGIGRIIITLEALSGVGIFGALVGTVIIKVMLPRQNAIVFSRYCYFDKNTQRFIVQFVNTTHARLVNADMCSVLKLGRANWIVRSAYRTPYVGESAWTFSVNGLWEYLPTNERKAAEEDKRFPQKEIDDFLRRLTTYDDDGLKFGITGVHGFSTFSAAKKYSLKDCWVVESKDSMPVDVLNDPDLKSERFALAFHFIPDKKQTFINYVEELKRDSKQGKKEAVVE